MRTAGRIVAAATGGLLLMGGLAACGGDDDGGQETAQESGDQETGGQESEGRESEDREDGGGAPVEGEDGGATEESAGTAPGGEGMDGTWEPIHESPIETLTVTGEEVETTGTLACPGTLSGEGAEARIELACETPDEQRSAGTVELDPDGTALFISWDGPEWGGMIDSFTRAG